MLLTTRKSVTTVEEIPFEVPTPFFSKLNEYGNWEYFAIEQSAEGATLVNLFVATTGGYRSMQVLPSHHTQFSEYAGKAMKGEEITETEFLRAITQLIPASKELIDL
jgi:hypothetical protein